MRRAGTSGAIGAPRVEALPGGRGPRIKIDALLFAAPVFYVFVRYRL